MIHVFEDLANSAFSKGTNFSICLSSRYWPQFKVQNCFTVQVELENQDDIVRYIQKHLEPTQFDQDPESHAVLRQEILEKAKGTFLWVVLVIQELLQANTGGATLRELRDIVRRVPPDLNQFYQHQLHNTKGEDRERMLRLFQLVFYAQEALSPTQVRLALAFGCGTYTSYADWSQSSDYVKSDEQMQKRIRGHSKGLVETSHHVRGDQDPAFSTPAVVQFIHQSVRDFLAADGFSFLRDRKWCTDSAEGHEFIKSACWNYLKIKDFEAMSVVDLQVRLPIYDLVFEMRDLVNDHPFLKYAVKYIFPHAAKAEKQGISQDGLRSLICSNTQAYFKRWRCLHDAVNFKERQGHQTRPIHVLAQYGLLTQEIAEKERNVDIVGGKYHSALLAACWGGHEDAVHILLGCGANPRFDARNFVDWDAWDQPMSAFMRTAARQDLPVLRQLLNDRRSSLTLKERLNVASTIRSETPQLDSFLAVLFPETIFPDTVLEKICEAAGKSALGTFSFLLDKSLHTIVHEEKLWHHVLGNSTTGIMSKTRILLDRGGTVKITEAILRRLHGNKGVRDKSKVLELLMQHCEVEMTKDFVDALSHFEDASRIICAFEAVGCRLEPFTPKQVSLVLQHGSAETVAFFLLRKDGNMSAEEMFDAALGNSTYGKEVTRLLLGYLNPDHIKEQALIKASNNLSCGDDLIELLHSRWSSLTFSEAALKVAVRVQSPDVVKFVLKRCECPEITEEILLAAMLNIYSLQVLDDLLNDHPDIRVQESMVIAAIPEFMGPSILDIFCRHDKPLFCTEDVVAAAAAAAERRLVDGGPDSLRIILQQDHDAKISSSMIMMAMRAVNGAGLISVMLEHDHTLVIEEEHLIAAASNTHVPRTVFAFLQTNGKLDSVDRYRNINRVKRRRISPKSPPRISTNVIDAAFSNPNEAARLQLLELFVEWGNITEADLDERMYLAPFESSPSSTDSLPSTINNSPPSLPSPLYTQRIIRSTSAPF